MLNYGLALSPSFLWYKLHVVLQIYARAMMLQLMIPPLTGWIVRAAIAATLFFAPREACYERGLCGNTANMVCKCVGRFLFRHSFRNKLVGSGTPWRYQPPNITGHLSNARNAST